MAELSLTGMPLDMQTDYAATERKRRMAEALMQQAMQGQQGVQAGRFYVPPSPLSPLVQAFQAYAGQKGQSDADKAQADLGGRYQQGLAEEVKRIAAMRQGQPATTDAADNIENPGTPGDPRAAVMHALSSQYGPVREMGKLDFQGDLKSKEAAAARIGRLEERAMVLEAQAEQKDLDRTAREAAATQANELRLEIAKLTKAAGGRSPYYQFLPTTGGYVAGNTRDGTVSPVTVDGKPLVRPTDDPTRQGDIAREKAKGDAAGKREFNMAGIGGVIKQAEDILNGAVKPTGSGFGSMVDSVAGFFGGSPAGSKEAQQLKAAAGALTAKMPRMEGPQSDRDVQLYRESAAEVGDDTVPVAKRLSALQVVKNLWLKYDKQNPDAFDNGPARISSDADYDALPSGAEFVGPDGQVRRKP